MPTKAKLTAIVVGLLVLLLVTSPIFFDIYRAAAFDINPHDDYSHYLLYLLGEGGHPAEAPYAYRLISYAVAAPFYYVLPAYAFSNLDRIEGVELKAIEAMALVSYLSIVLTAVVMVTIARKQYQATRAAALIVGLLAVLLANFTETAGIDPFAILMISLLVLWQEQPLIFGPLVLISIGINEKIPIIFATLLAFRLVVALVRQRPFTLYAQFVLAGLAVSGYFTLTFILKIPSCCDLPTTPALLLDNILSTLKETLCLKGLIQVILPLMVLLSIFITSLKARQRGTFHLTDLSGLLILLLMSFIADIGTNVGRVIMYTYPLYLPAAAIFIDEVIDRKDAAIPAINYKPDVAGQD